MDKRPRFNRPIIGALSLIYACLAQADDVFTLPAAADRPMEEIGRILIIDMDPVLRTKVAGLFDAQNKEIRHNRLVGVGEHTMLLTPGTYTVAINCDSGGSWYPLPTKLRVDAGQTYTLWCKNITGMAARVKFKSESHAQWEASRAQSK